MQEQLAGWQSTEARERLLCSAEEREARHEARLAAQLAATLTSGKSRGQSAAGERAAASKTEPRMETHDSDATQDCKMIWQS